MVIFHFAMLVITRGYLQFSTISLRRWTPNIWFQFTKAIFPRQPTKLRVGYPKKTSEDIRNMAQTIVPWSKNKSAPTLRSSSLPAPKAWTRDRRPLCRMWREISHCHSPSNMVRKHDESTMLMSSMKSDVIHYVIQHVIPYQSIPYTSSNQAQ